MKLKKSNNKKLYDFLIDKANKSAIVTLFAFLMLLVFNIFIKNLFLRIVFYLGFYLLVNNYYLKVVNYFFVDNLKMAATNK